MPAGNPGGGEWTTGGDPTIAKKKDSDAKVAIYANPTDSYKSFAQKYQNLIQGVSDPKKFASILQNKGKFGIGENGPLSDYADSIKETSIKLRHFIYGENK